VLLLVDRRHVQVQVALGQAIREVAERLDVDEQTARRVVERALGADGVRPGPPEAGRGGGRT
jgi:stress response protein YsnF